jgi:opine dehydrogenase
VRNKNIHIKKRGHMRTIAVLGGGHGARTVAADMTLAGHRVTIFEMPEFRENMKAIFETRVISLEGKARNGRAEIYKVTSDIRDAIADVEIILIVVPAPAHLPYARLLGPVTVDGQNVVLIPGTLGSLEFVEELRRQHVNKDITVSELDTLPYATRIAGLNSVYAYHKLKEFSMGVFPSIKSAGPLRIMQDLYPEVKLLRDVLEAGLSNCNPIVHPLGVLMNAGRIEYSRGEFWYYEEGITPSTARAMGALDQERIQIGRKLQLDLPDIASSLHAVGYGPKGDLWETLKGSKGLTPIKGPTSLVNRYVTEDIPIGLVCWSQLGRQLGVSTKLMEATVHIAGAIAGRDYFVEGRTLQRCGIAGLDGTQLVEYVRTGRR